MTGSVAIQNPITTYYTVDAVLEHPFLNTVMPRGARPYTTRTQPVEAQFLIGSKKETLSYTDLWSENFKLHSFLMISP